MDLRNLEKLIRAVDLLSGENGVTLSGLEKGLGVSRRSVYRMLDALNEFNFPIYDDKRPMEKEKRWMLDEDYVAKLPNVSLPTLTLSVEESLLLNYLLSGKRTLMHSDIKRKIEVLISKLSVFGNDAGAGNRFIEKFDSIFVNTDHCAKDYSGKEEIIETLIDSIVQQKTCVVKYHAFSTDEVKQFRIDPLKLIEHHGGLYAFVRVTRFGSIRIIAIERIQEVFTKAEVFDYPEDFDPEALLESSFELTFDDPIEAVIWFSPWQAPYVEERRWASKQEIKHNADGSIEMTIATSGVFDLKKWILSFGSEARVIMPTDLAREISSEAEAIVKSYKKSR
jgi:predicted DNA-binding transcriptional regulator YafY